MLSSSSSSYFVTLLLALATCRQVSGHGMMLDPPQRSSMWRYGFNVPTNYDDNALYCGGIEATYDEVNQGRCGECGDEWKLPRPRPNDEGGFFGTGLIGQTYSQGQVVRIEIELTASHLGHFEFYLCPKESADELVTQECLDRYPLQLLSGSYRYEVLSSVAQFHYPVVKLPEGVHCEHCVIQWKYKGGNNWGTCPDGSTGLGCGPQELFQNCADVAIKPSVNK